MKENFDIYSAPIQGFTDRVWRRAHHALFGGVDRYYSPFLRVERGEPRRRDLVDVLPENNAGVPLVPQLIACPPDHAALLARTLRDVGHSEVDINLGCPYAPMALHHKGSGMLQYPDELDAMVDALLAIDGVKYSVKMRLGWDDPTQWRGALKALERLRPTQVTVHPRIGRQQYKGDLYLDEMDAAVDALAFTRVIYNGDLKTLDDVRHIADRWPSLAGVMVGRGLIENPAMLSPGKVTPDNYRALHDAVFDEYARRMNGGDKQLVQKMRAFWEMYLPNAERRYLKAIKKSTTLDRYLTAVNQLFSAGF